MLYKELLLAARGYPGGMGEARRKLKAAFRADHDLDTTDPAELTRVTTRGKQVISSLHALTRLHKYRTMRRRYTKSDDMD